MIINLGNLLNSAFINAGAIAMRFRSPQDIEQLHVARGKNERYVWVFTLIAFLFSMSTGWISNVYITYSLGALSFGGIIFLSTLS